jgi:MraZ protein
VIAGAVDCDVDKLGRLLLPSTLRQHAGLQRDVIWVGMGKHIELWNTERYAAVREAALGDESKRQEMGRRLADLGL